MKSTVKVVSAKPTPFWNLRIAVAKEMKDRTGTGFTSDDEGKAQMWYDCACGNQDPRIPRYTAEEIEKLDKTHPVNNCSIGAPKDRILARLGLQFADQVSEDNVNGASDTLDKIERRSATLLLRMRQKGKK